MAPQEEIHSFGLILNVLFVPDTEASIWVIFPFFSTSLSALVFAYRRIPS